MSAAAAAMRAAWLARLPAEVLLCLFAMLLLAAADALAKGLAARWNPLQIAWRRSAVALLSVLVLIGLRGMRALAMLATRRLAGSDDGLTTWTGSHRGSGASAFTSSMTA